jgi:hypothetical protein
MAIMTGGLVVHVHENPAQTRSITAVFGPDHLVVQLVSRGNLAAFSTCRLIVGDHSLERIGIVEREFQISLGVTPAKGHVVLAIKMMAKPPALHVSEVPHDSGSACSRRPKPSCGLFPRQACHFADSYFTIAIEVGLKHFSLGSVLFV